MMQLQMKSQMALIGMNSTQPLLELRSRLPKIELQIEEPRLEIRSPRPVLHIDQTQCFADHHKRNLADFAAYYANLAWSDSMEGIARRAIEGDLLAQIHKDFSIGDLFTRHLGETAEFNVTAIPKQPPRIWIDTFPVQYKLKRGKVNLDFQPGQVDIRFHKGKLNIYLRQQNYLEIYYIDNKVDKVA